MRTRDRNIIITHDLVVGHEYEVIVQAVDSTGRIETEEDSPKNVILIEGKQTGPAAITNVSIAAQFLSLVLSWTNPVDADFDHMEIYRATTNDFDADPGGAALVAVVKGDTFYDYIGSTGATRYYWLRAINTSGQLSAFYPATNTTTILATTQAITTANIDDFSITATKMYNNIIILLADAWTNNSPGAGSVAWNAHSIIYGGASYPITGGNTAAAYIYWTIGNATYSTSATHPALGTTAFMIAINTGGIHTLVWNDSANMVIGTAFISDLAVTTAKINNLAVTNAKIGLLAVDTAQIAALAVETAKIDNLAVTTGKIALLAVDTAQIAAAAITNAKIDNLAVTNAKVNDLSADKITAGTITGSTLQTAASGQRIVVVHATNTLIFHTAGESDVITMDDNLNGSNRPSIWLNSDAGGYVSCNDKDNAGNHYSEMYDGSMEVWRHASGFNHRAVRDVTDANVGIYLALQSSGTGLLFQGATGIGVNQFTVDTSGNIVLSGTVDGRDVDADGTKLDTIETNADETDTANVTAAMTDGAHGTRAGGTLHADVVAAGADGFMTGSDKTKLNSIEALADVTDTANVTAAMTNGAHGTRSGGTLHADVIAGGADGFMTGGDKTKLNGIAAGADVTGSNAPQAHNTSHENGQSDEISVTGLSGELADNQPPKAHAASHLSAGADTLTLTSAEITSSYWDGQFTDPDNASYEFNVANGLITARILK